MKRSESGPTALSEANDLACLQGIPVLFRCDGSPEIGLGHVVRCLTLAAAFREAGSGPIQFLVRAYSNRVVEKVVGAGFRANILPVTATADEDLDRTVSFARGLPQSGRSPMVITDSHDFPAEFYKALKQAGLAVLSIDDYAGVEYASDIVLNHNITATSYSYKVSSYTNLLLGPAYFPLRKEFRKLLVATRPQTGEVNHILVSLGGMPALEDLQKVILGIQRFAKEEASPRVTLVMGLQDNSSERSDFIRALPPSFQAVDDSLDLAVPFRDADLAIVNGGVSAYEAASLGLPLIMISLGASQDDTVVGFAKSGACVALGRLDELECDEIAQALSRLHHNVGERFVLGHQARSVVDGQGTQRILRELISLCG